MKKFNFLFILLIPSTFLFAFNWNSVVGLFKKTINTLSYTIETSGTNPRVYEFDTQGYPKMHCIVLFRDNSSTAPAMQCVKTTNDMVKINSKIIKDQ